MRLGYFKEFKGSNMVLLSCNSVEVGSLRASISRSMSHGFPLAMHDLAKVSHRHPVRLFLSDRAATVDAVVGDFVWRLTDNEYSDLDDKLAALEGAIAGHQYFSLPGTSAELVVSVGEYPDQWWLRDA
jgi:hypothetical protein